MAENALKRLKGVLAPTDSRGHLGTDAPSRAWLAAPREDSESAEPLTVVREIVDALVRGDRELKGALQEILPRLAGLLRMDAAAVFAVRTGSPVAEMIAAYGRTRQRGFPYADLPLDEESIAGAVRRLHTIEVGPETALSPALEAVLCRRMAAGLVIPASVGHSLTGLLVLSSRVGIKEDVATRDVLEAVRGVVGLALRNQELSTETRGSAAVLEAAYAVSRAISRSLDLEQTFSMVASNAARIIPGSHCLVLQVEKESGELVAVAGSDTEGVDLRGLRIRAEETLGDTEHGQGRRSIVVEDLVWGARVGPDLRHKLQMQSALLLPMSAGSTLMGSLLLYTTDRRRRFSREEVARAEDIADQAAAAIQNAWLYRDLTTSQSRVRALLARLGRIREHERQTFASLVHDDVVQSIVGATYELQVVRDAVSSEAQPDVDRILGILRDSIKDARRIIWELRPPVLDELGFAESLRALADRIGGRSDTRVHVDVGRLPDLTKGATTGLYKIAREALLNARRHGRSSRLELLVDSSRSAEGTLLRLRVRDDGVGFDTRQVRVGDHFGLALMEEQAALIGAELKLDSAIGRGTTVEVTLPVPEEGVEA